MIQISLPGSRMVGIRTLQEFSDTFSASSTQQMSTPSVDLILVTLFLIPLKMNSLPFVP